MVLHAGAFTIGLLAGGYHLGVADGEDQPPAGTQHTVHLPQSEGEFVQIFADQGAQHGVEALVFEGQRSL
jgi:hypothetical protein